MFDVRLLPMAVRDLDDVIAIEKRSHLSPWTIGQFSDSLDAGYWAYTLKKLGLEDAPDQTIGYCILMPSLDELSLLNITVDPDHRRQGWAEKILSVMEDQALQKNFKTVYLEVRASNQAAIHLYQKIGYEQVGIRKAYYPVHESAREDALVMKKELQAL